MSLPLKTISKIVQISKTNHSYENFQKQTLTATVVEKINNKHFQINLQK